MKTFTCQADPDDALTAVLYRGNGRTVICVDVNVDDRSDGVWLTPTSARDLADELRRLADKAEATA